MSDTPEAGHNNPPSPFEDLKQTFDDLFLETSNWADREPIKTQDQADVLEALKKKIKAAIKASDTMKAADKKPHQEAAQAIQDAHNALTGKTQAGKGIGVLALEACQAVLQPWLKQLDDERKAKLKLAQEIADAKAKELEKAAKTRDTSNIESIVAFEASIQETKQSEIDLKRAAKATTKGTTTQYIPIVVDGGKAANHYWKTDREEIVALLMKFAARDIRGGKREIPGFEIKEELKVR